MWSKVFFIGLMIGSFAVASTDGDVLGGRVINKKDNTEIYIECTEKAADGSCEKAHYIHRNGIVKRELTQVFEMKEIDVFFGNLKKIVKDKQFIDRRLKLSLKALNITVQEGNHTLELKSVIFNDLLLRILRSKDSIKESVHGAIVTSEDASQKLFVIKKTITSEGLETSNSITNYEIVLENFGEVRIALISFSDGNQVEILKSAVGHANRGKEVNKCYMVDEARVVHVKNISKAIHDIFDVDLKDTESTFKLSHAEVTTFEHEYINNTKTYIKENFNAIKGGYWRPSATYISPLCPEFINLLSGVK